MEIAHTNLTEVTWMVFVHHNSMMVHTTSITTTSWMLSMLANTTMAGTHMPSLLPILSETCRNKDKQW